MGIQRSIMLNGKEADQHILMLSPDVFTALRISPERDQYILTLTNVTNKVCHLNIPLYKLGTRETNWYDLVSGMEWMAENQELFITMQPYDVIWLEPLRQTE